MDTPSNPTPPHSPIPVWSKIGAVVFVLLLGIVFFVLASGRMRHRLDDEVPPAGSVPGQPGPVISH